MPTNEPEGHDDRLEAGSIVVEEFEGLDLAALRAEADDLLGRGAAGARNLLMRSARFRALGETGILGAFARHFLDKDARPVNLTLFDKTPEANWKVPWHQDLTIAVRERRQVEGFGPWSVKDGVQHVQPPVAILERIVAVRVHLDDTPAENGALRVVPGSHRYGKLEPERAAALRKELGVFVCPVPAGGAMLMSPLLLHASSASSVPSRRRVLHYQFAAVELPGGLAWA